MAAFVIYILKWAISLTLLYSLYGLFLRKETFHHFNRMVLIGILLTSMVLPFCTIHTKEETIVSKGMSGIEESISNEIVIRYQPAEEIDFSHQYTRIEENPKANTPTMSLVQWLVLLGLLGTAYFWGSYLISIVKLCFVMKNSRPIDGNGKLPQGIRLLANPTIHSPFSWFRTIVIRSEDTPQPTDIILTHELAHVQHHHSWDNLLCDITVNTLWWLPFAWMLRRDLRDVHEYQADQAVMEAGFDVEAYQMLLIDKSTGERNEEIVNNFEQNPLKRRFMMMFRDKSNKYAGLKVLYILPLAAIALAAFAKPDMMEAVENEVTTEMEPFSSAFSGKKNSSDHEDDTPIQEDEEKWNIDPRGIYKMTKMTGRDGIEIEAPNDQYKICRDDVTITFRVATNNANPKKYAFYFCINDAIIYNYTGKVPQGEDMHGTQIYDSNGKEFTMRWRSQYKDHPLFSENNWVVEKYERDTFSKHAQEILELLKSGDFSNSRNPFEGRWILWKQTDSEEECTQTAKKGAGKESFSPDEFRVMMIQGNKELSMSMVKVSNPTKFIFLGGVSPCSHQGDKQLKLDDLTYTIHWQGKNHFYHKGANGKFWLWVRDSYSPNYYDYLIDLLRVSSREALSVPTNLSKATTEEIEYPASESDSIYIGPNVSIAEFPGGDGELLNYMRTHVRYPDATYWQYGMEGRVMISFVVEKGGSLQNFTVARNGIKANTTAAEQNLSETEFENIVNTGKHAFEEAVIQALQSMPDWRPAVHETDGKMEYVHMKYTIPVTFRL
ncbi:MAG: hypothetical protein IJ635_12200 [Bacteroidaceae bacterium]|nr:hypothetical protein [Bacteroidaceae bacterium]